MAFQLSAECLSEIIEYLVRDKISLKSCLLVDRFWCKVTIRILWRNIWENVRYKKGSHIPLSILSILSAYLPDESRNLLNENGISIPTSTPPSFHSSKPFSF